MRGDERREPRVEHDAAFAAIERPAGRIRGRGVDDRHHDHHPRRLDRREADVGGAQDEERLRAARDRHQRRTLILAIATVAGILLAVSLAIAAATYLNQYWFLHFPLGFYLLAQGVLILLIAAAFWFTRMQEHIDHKRSESEELG